MSDHVNAEFFGVRSFEQSTDEHVGLPIWARIAIIVLLSLTLWVVLWRIAQSCTRLILAW